MVIVEVWCEDSPWQAYYFTEVYAYVPYSTMLAEFGRY